MHQLQGNKEYGSEKKGYLLKKSDGYVRSQPGVPCVLSIPPGASSLGTCPSRSGRETHLQSRVHQLRTVLPSGKAGS